MNTTKFTNIRQHWIWGIIFGSLSLIFAGTALFLQYKSSRHEYGGILNAKFHERHLYNNDARTVVVCVDDTSYIPHNIYLTPTFDNPDEFTLRDFSLNFEVNSYDVELFPSQFTQRYQTGPSSYFFQYSQNVLHAHMDTKNPFAGFKLKKETARCEITSKVSFDGAESLYEYRTDVWFIYKPNKKNLSFDYWKLNCKQRVFELIDDQNFDIYYITKNNDSEYQFDVLLAKKNIKPNDEKKEENNNTDVEKNDTNKINLVHLTREEEEVNGDLEIEDYKYHYCDSSKLEVTFNKPAKYDANFFITFLAKDGWKTKKLYGALHLNKGEQTTTVYVWSNPEKIADLTLYHQISAKNNFIVEHNKDNYFITRKYENTMYAKLIYPDKGIYYVTLGDNIDRRSVKYDKQLIIEAYSDNTIIDKILNKVTRNDAYKILGICILLGIIVTLGIIKTEHYLFLLIIMGFVILFLSFSILFLIYFICSLFNYLINYFYLMF